ncbi:hypothetical protein OH76DRAFT_413064 [Lentinus brumalis]|uniref:Uncharacterized protein n=1 Tax=Lentinus brumalis TaxID=2498619 RepID=A0A371DW15_9APHY|nr:hypothetical protein OH76DRAFT_413064 [Polyporus brumalis]
MWRFDPPYPSFTLVMSQSSRPLTDRPSFVERYHPYARKTGPRHARRGGLVVTVDRRFNPEQIVEEAAVVPPSVRHADERPEEEDVPVFGTADAPAAAPPARGRLAAILAVIAQVLRFGFFA